MSDIFDVDLETGFLTRTLADNTVLQTTFDELSGGRLRLSGNRVVVNETGETLSVLSPLFRAQVEQLGDGRLLLQRQISDAEINTNVFTGGSDAIGFNYEIELPTGEIVSAEVPLAFIGKVGSQLIVRSVDTPTPVFENLVPEIDRLTGEILNMPPDARFATSEEAKMRAIEGFLLKQERSTLERIAAQAITDESGSVLETPYDVAAFIARSVVSDVIALHVREL